MSETHPSTAHYAKGKYVHDADNQAYAEQERLGNTGPHDIGQLTHPTSISGYCKHLVLGGYARE
jgi:hypothetical protein